MTPRHTAIICILLPGMLTICFRLYSPGLHGPFVFDDWANLPALNGFGDGIHRGLTFWWYVLGNNSGPLGRPLSMLSRSAEHTSELQSLMRLSYAVFCLKKNINTTLAANPSHVADTIT